MSNDPINPKDGARETREKEQGLLLECIHCTVLYPSEERPNCPECKGAKMYFVPAHMMDKESSQNMIITELSTFFKEQNDFLPVHEHADVFTQENAEKLRKEGFRLLKKLIMYDFDFQEYLKDLIRQLESKKD